MQKIKHVQARHYKKVETRMIDLIVVHTMESPEKPDTAEGVANWFHGPTSPIASAHYCIDSNTIVQCVFDHDVAFGAPNANHNGLHFEHAGKASQRAVAWSDPYSTRELLLSAELAAIKSREYGIPLVHLTPAQIRLGKLGFVGHADITKAYPGSGTHTDPGPNFPWPLYLRYVKAFKAGHKPKV
jgi:N-acetyl-anhydromuramyl-L-alanine amidase AmpD